MREGNKIGSREITGTWIGERHECEEEQRSRAKERGGRIMEPHKNTP